MKAKTPAPPKRSMAKQREKSGPSGNQNGFLTVAIGASAGGIEAFTELIRALPSTTGMAFVLVQHLDPTHHSILTELLAKETTMRVREVSDGMQLQQNHVYVILPNATMAIAHRVLQMAAG